MTVNNNKQAHLPDSRKGPVMNHSQSKCSAPFPPEVRIVAVATFVSLLLVSSLATRAQEGNDNRAPDVPDSLLVPEGNKVHFHAYAVGVQIYTCKENADGGFSWVFKAP